MRAFENIAGSARAGSRRAIRITTRMEEMMKTLMDTPEFAYYVLAVALSDLEYEKPSPPRLVYSDTWL